MKKCRMKLRSMAHVLGVFISEPLWFSNCIFALVWGAFADNRRVKITWQRVDVRKHLFYVPLRWTSDVFFAIRNADCFCHPLLLLSLLLSLSLSLFAEPGCHGNRKLTLLFLLLVFLGLLWAKQPASLWSATTIRHWSNCVMVSAA